MSEKARLEVLKAMSDRWEREIKHFRKTMRSFLPECLDECNEVNCTLLAEKTADALDIYESDNETIPEWLFDMAVEVSEEK